MAELLRFKSKGALGLYYGMGIEETEVDFTNMDGLITLAGPNGRGKTTFLEMLSPFYSFPSRQLKDPKRYNFKNQFRDRDSFKEVTYRHLGKEYVFRIEVPAGTTMSPEGYIYCDGEPLVKGKISEYKKMVSELFGSEKLFYSSIFSCQNGKKLTDLPVGEFKQLLIELLGLERYTEMWRNIKPAIDECELAMKEVEKEQELLSQSAAEIDENKARINTSNEQMGQAVTQLNETDRRITETREHIKGLQAKLEKARQDEFVIQEKTKTLDAIRDERAEVGRKIAEAKQKHGDRIEAIRMQEQPYRDLLLQKDDIETATVEISRLQALETHLNALIENIQRSERMALDSVSGFERETSELKEQRYKSGNIPRLIDIDEDLTGRNKYLTETRAALRERQQWLKGLDQDPVVLSLKRDLEGYAYVKGLLDKRPDACTIDDCPFIVDALEGQKRKTEKEQLLVLEEQRVHESRGTLENEIAEIEREIIDTENHISRLITERETLSKKVAEKVQEIDNQIQAKERLATNHRQLIKKAQAEMACYRDELKQIPPKIQALEELAGKASDIAEAERNLRDINQAIHLENESYSETSQGFFDKWNKLQDAHHAIETEIGELKDSAVSRPLVEKDLADHENLVTSLDGTRQQFRDRITTLKHTVETCRENIGKLQKDADRIEELKTREQFIRQEINRWTYARAAVSKSGLQAMEIAAAAPLLTSWANNILHGTFGGAFYVDLITVDPETGAEILDVMVTREDGETFPLSSYSGGETVWLLQSFKAAQVLMNAEKSGVQFLTAFADEESGSLDKEKAEKFILMYRELMNQGGFSKLIYISHIQECQAMADHVLTFEDGGIRAA